MIDRNHSLRKGISPVVMFSRMARLDAIQRGLRAVAFKLQAGEAVSQDVVEVGDALLNHLEEALELLLGVTDLRLQRRDRGEDRRQTLGSEEPFGQVLGHEGVEPVHRDRPARPGFQCGIGASLQTSLANKCEGQPPNSPWSFEPAQVVLRPAGA